MMKKSDIGMIGLAVMGENLSLNLLDHGFTVSVYSVDRAEIDRFVSGRGKGRAAHAAYTLEDFAASLEKPRKVFMLIKAGAPVDETIEKLLGVLEPGDIIIDGGNSHFPDTIRRAKYVESKGLFYLGCGVSGGGEGARKGPSLMPGGSREAWEAAAPILQKICARTEDGSPCCEYVGGDGAGHFVKMVHNGIEYGDMQLICEAYALMRDYLGMSAGEMSEVFAKWNGGELCSYLIEITGKILAYKDADGSSLVDKILDTAGQKGTGKWTGIAALDEGVPLTLIGEAVFARCLSAAKEERVAASRVFDGPKEGFKGDREAFIEDIGRALYMSKIISYAQGFSLLRAAAKTYGWDLNYGGVALMWRGGCIIRSVFLGKIKEAFDKDPGIANLLLDPYFTEATARCQAGLRRVCASAMLSGVPVPAFASALCYFDGYRTEKLPANLLQAQRDYFGAHTYERNDAPRGKFFHTDWTGEGGGTSSTTYNA